MKVTIEQVQTALNELLKRASHGEIIVITEDSKPIAELHPPSPTPGERVFGKCKGMLNIVSEDDEHLADFAEYME